MACSFLLAGLLLVRLLRVNDISLSSEQCDRGHRRGRFVRSASGSCGRAHSRCQPLRTHEAPREEFKKFWKRSRKATAEDPDHL